MDNKRKLAARKTTISDKELSGILKQKRGVLDVRIISPAEVETAAWVRLKCQFGCDGFGQCLVCPPFTPTPDEMRKVLDSYRRAALLHLDNKVNIKALTAELERDIFLRGAWKALGLGAGSCPFCRECNIQEKSCRHAERARPSMEACGIDVFSTVKKFGLPIEVVRTTRQCPNFYGLLLID
jgi:predicted metal-binding protein